LKRAEAFTVKGAGALNVRGQSVETSRQVSTYIPLSQSNARLTAFPTRIYNSKRLDKQQDGGLTAAEGLTTIEDLIIKGQPA